jgi:hypothetical protein
MPKSPFLTASGLALEIERGAGWAAFLDSRWSWTVMGIIPGAFWASLADRHRTGGFNRPWPGIARLSGVTANRSWPWRLVCALVLAVTASHVALGAASNYLVSLFISKKFARACLQAFFKAPLEGKSLDWSCFRACRSGPWGSQLALASARDLTRLWLTIGQRYADLVGFRWCHWA